jgi:prolyl oligopeptidase
MHKGLSSMEILQYPNTPIVDQVDDYHGTLVSDPYRWLEDANSPETKAWIESQNRLTQSFLKDIPSKERIRKRLTTLWDYPRALAPHKVGGKYFQLRNTGLQNQDVLYWMDSLDGEKHVLLDPNELSEDGTIALTNWEVSKDGNLLAYAVNASGSDWQIWRIRDVRIGKDLPDKLEWSKFSSITWLPNSSGFYYCGYDEPEESKTYEGVNLDQKVYFHLIGTDQSEDQLIYSRPDQPEWGFDTNISDDGKYLILHVWQGTDIRNRLFFRKLDSSENFIELIYDLEARYQFIANDGQVFYIHTDYEAPHGRLISIDTQNPDKSLWRTIIAESEDTLENIELINNQFVAIYLHDAHNQVKRFDFSGKFMGDIDLPTIGSIFSLDREKYLFGDRNDDELFFTFNSFIYPPSVMRYSFSTTECVEIESPNINFDFSNYQLKQVFVKSKDGTPIPMFLVTGKGHSKNKSNPTLLYGYGGFNISLTPNFMVNRLVWLELGGTLAIANLRGGGEYGEEWHKAGSLLNKQNVFDDMIACAEYLIEFGYTSPQKLVIEGRSNGGLLVGACLTQRPDLFGAALPAVGVMDMLRFHKFTIGWAWVSDYGSADEKDQFKVLYSYSPLHNIKSGGSYPATLVTTADHDDRVVPGHSFKFISTLQTAQGGNAPVLIRIQTKAGHGFGKPTKILIEEQTDIFAFLVKTLNIDTI